MCNWIACLSSVGRTGTRCNFACPRLKTPEYATWIPNCEYPIWNVTGYDTPRSKDRAGTDVNTGQNKCSAANPQVRTDLE